MPGVSAIVFGAKHLTKEEIQGKRVIDVGACDFNGSIRPLIESWKPSEYIGVDIIEGPCVDIVCSADNLVEKFGKESFDVVISVEMLEHSRCWQKSISNMKQICKPEGFIMLTTRSYGYPCHGYPNDFWRFELEDMKNIFDDCDILALEEDYQAPGIFIKTRKPKAFQENYLSDYKLYSMVTNGPINILTDNDFKSPYFYRLGMKQKIKNLASTFIRDSGKLVSNLMQI
ncbi:methyltransferase domain-containing protein [Lyngbya confervoides]|uniref:Class I SAM-dependent methyltransferase n=1 Tax=Lyngbya confervoides BDU141951 TaxID=1574623 RepID=A0ABD4SWY8_9CYAN|nr:methyltransferase domain-containing protein [Lyngbya confervoides]MCM1981246.1 class I SAM-dependent methyltransferase [Lyngbya confervoides BDU141951]